MTTPQIHGYVVVRPHRHYFGVDRMPWEHTETAYYAGTLPERLREIYGRIEQPGLWLPRFVSELPLAEAFLDWERRACSDAEIVAFSAPYLSDIGVPTQPVDHADYIGIDVIGGVGEWSLIRALFDELPPDHPGLVAMRQLLNQLGLLVRMEDGHVLVTLYDRLAEEDWCEQRLVDDDRFPWQLVQVLRLRR